MAQGRTVAGGSIARAILRRLGLRIALGARLWRRRSGGPRWRNGARARGFAAVGARRAAGAGLRRAAVAARGARAVLREAGKHCCPGCTGGPGGVGGVGGPGGAGPPPVQRQMFVGGHGTVSLQHIWRGTAVSLACLCARVWCSTTRTRINKRCESPDATMTCRHMCLERLAQAGRALPRGIVVNRDYKRTKTGMLLG